MGVSRIQNNVPVGPEGSQSSEQDSESSASVDSAARGMTYSELVHMTKQDRHAREVRPRVVNISHSIFFSVAARARKVCAQAPFSRVSAHPHVFSGSPASFASILSPTVLRVLSLALGTAAAVPCRRSRRLTTRRCVPCRPALAAMPTW